MNDEQRPTGEQPPTPDESADHLVSVDEPWLLERVRAGEAGDAWAGVAELLEAAAGPPEPHELHGERAAVSSFLAAREAAAARHTGHGARRVAVVSTLMAGKFAAFTVAGLVTLGAGGMAAAAYTGLLPGPLQDVAHRTIGAPLPDRGSVHPPTPSVAPTTSTPSQAAPTSAAAPPARTTTTSSTTAAGSRTTTTTTSVLPSVADLCTAWRHETLSTSGAGFAALSAAAGSSSIDDFCASLSSPTTAPASPTTTPTAEPTATPSDTPAPTGEPTTTPPSTASDQPTPPVITASDQPPPPPTREKPGDEPTGP
jgi:hypothetical protein